MTQGVQPIRLPEGRVAVVLPQGQPTNSPILLSECAIQRRRETALDEDGVYGTVTASTYHGIRQGDRVCVRDAAGCLEIDALEYPELVPDGHLMRIYGVTEPIDDCILWVDR